ncbi:MAG TPA: MotA/TolQ/ExbB proton channel family protein [Mariprofundaceae bacterium]|nr:MotA/TolQ/ExbB proton channel family protein [Mariprofundaceae bacterium]
MAGIVRQQAVDQRGLKTLVLWMTWAISSAAVFALLYRQAGALNFVLHDSTRITWIIIGMFALGVLVSFVQVGMLTAEWFRAYRMEVVIRSGGLKAVKPRRSSRIVDRFLASVQTILDRNGRLDVEGLVDVEFAAQHRTSQFVGLLGNLLITLGLIGTVMGMTLIMIGLNSALNSLGENEQLMLQGLKNAMSGMGVAFYTTLLGSILGGVLLRVFSWITDSSVEGLQDLMLRVCLVHASADMVPSTDREIRLLDADFAQLHARIDLVRQAFEASRSEMQAIGGEMRRMHEILKEAAADDSMRQLAVQHARYAYKLHRHGLIARLLGRRSSAD